MVAQVGYSVAGRSRGRVAPCAVCTWHVETRSASFLVEPQNQGHMAASELPQAGQRELEPQVTWRHGSCPGLGSGGWSRRTRGGTGALPGWAAGAGAAGHVVAPELLRRVLSSFRQFGLKTGGDGFSRFALKTGGRVSWLSLRNQGGGGFLGLGLKTGSSGLVIWASKSLRRFLGLGLKIKWASGCRLRHKTDGGRSARDMHQNLAVCLASKQVWLGFSSLA
jgi:hypothetical protein